MPALRKKSISFRLRRYSCRDNDYRAIKPGIAVNAWKRSQLWFYNRQLLAVLADAVICKSLMQITLRGTVNVSGAKDLNYEMLASKSQEN